MAATNPWISSFLHYIPAISHAKASEGSFSFQRKVKNINLKQKIKRGGAEFLEAGTGLA